MILFRNFAASLAIALTLAAAPAMAAPNNGGDSSGDQYAVCSAILESCMAVCGFEPYSDAVLDPRVVCERQCREAYLQCMKGLIRTDINQSKRKLFGPLNQQLDGTPNNDRGNNRPGENAGSDGRGSDAKPPVEPGGDGKDGGAFDRGSVTGGGGLVFSPN